MKAIPKILLFGRVVTLGATLFFSTQLMADEKNQPNPISPDPKSLLLEACYEEFGMCMEYARGWGDDEQGRPEFIAGCFADLNQCVRNVSRGAPSFPIGMADPVFNPNPNPDNDLTITPVAPPLPPFGGAGCGPQLVAGDNRTWGEWATDLCSDAWKNNTGVQLPPIPNPDFSGFMGRCMDKLKSFCPEPIQHPQGPCGDGCDGKTCISSGGIMVCPSPIVGLPTLPGLPVRVPILNPVLIFP